MKRRHTDHVRVKINRSPVCANESQSDCFALVERIQNLPRLISNNEHLTGTVSTSPWPQTRYRKSTTMLISSAS